MNTRASARVAIIGVLLFLLLLVILHFLEPEFDPSRNLISEYELGRYGWVMSLAFFSLGVGVLGMLLSTWHSVRSKRGTLGRWWFLVISAAFFGAGIFYPYPTPNTASLIHGICGAIIIGTFPIAATLYSSNFSFNPEWTTLRGRFRWATVLVWVGLLSFMGSIIVLGVLSGSTDRTTASLPIGWQNRFMILTYSLWIIVISWQLAVRHRVAELKR